MVLDGGVLERRVWRRARAWVAVRGGALVVVVVDVACAVIFELLLA